MVTKEQIIASHINTLIVAKEFLIVNKNKKTKNSQKSYAAWAKDYADAYTALVDLGIPLVCGQIVYDPEYNMIVAKRKAGAV